MKVGPADVKFFSQSRDRRWGYNSFTSRGRVGSITRRLMQKNGKVSLIYPPQPHNLLISDWPSARRSAASQLACSEDLLCGEIFLPRIQRIRESVTTRSMEPHRTRLL